jgi:hypothetical protein
MPTRDEIRTMAALQDLPSKLAGLTAAVERLAPQPEYAVISNPDSLTSLDLALIETALEQHRIHCEEEADGLGDEHAQGMQERLAMIDVTVDKVRALALRR